MRGKERKEWLALLERERERWRLERQEILNRIANPKQIVVDPREPREPQPMKQEDMEFAFIGREVPDGATVGSLRDSNGDHPG